MEKVRWRWRGPAVDCVVIAVDGVVIAVDGVVIAVDSVVIAVVNVVYPVVNVVNPVVIQQKLHTFSSPAPIIFLKNI